MMRQGTISLEMREFKPDDYARLLEVYNANYPDYTRSLNEVRSRDESLDRTKYLLKRYSFLSPDTETILGFGELSHVPDMFHSRKFWVNIWVDPELQGRGIGGTIYEKLSSQLAKLDAVAAWAGAKEDLPKLVGFYRKRGFQEKLRAWESRLDVKSMDASRFRAYSEKVEKQGIEITTLAEEQKHAQGPLTKIHELVQLVSADMPSISPFTPISYDQWEAFELKNPDLIPEGYMIAKDGPHPIGVSTVWRSDKEPKSLYQGNTGVRRDYRGRGIAVALKLRVIDFARRNGYEKVKTWNASNNAPMLAVNTKLGFKREVGWLTMEKALQ